MQSGPTRENGDFRPGQYCENDLAGRERGLELIAKLSAPSLRSVRPWLCATLFHYLSMVRRVLIK